MRVVILFKISLTNEIITNYFFIFVHTNYLIKYVN